jgi:agmatine deiminase
MILRFPQPTPREEGYRWPAEWEQHEATFLAWPHDLVTWGHALEAVEDDFARFTAVLSQGETVHLLVTDAAAERRVREILRVAGARHVNFHRIPTADAWFRDYGPIVVRRGHGKKRERVALDFRFNAWGEKYPMLVADDGVPARLTRVHGLPSRRVAFVLEGGSIDGNGKGTVLTTEQCLLHPNRNSIFTKEEIEAHLREWLGARHVLWLGRGVAGDDTDGHVDDIARFVGPRTVVAAVEEDRSSPNYDPLADNLRRLHAMADQDGRPLEIVELPTPEPVMAENGTPLPASYANFLIANRVVAVPAFGTKRDRRAREILAGCFPDRQVVPIPSRALVAGLGALHCLSMQLPR